MTRARSAFKKTRQVINMDLVNEADYDDKVILCLPKFAWDVARAFLSRQAQWKTTYAMAYSDNYYETPDAAEMDIIQASIDMALGEDDMSCDLAEALETASELLAETMNDNSEDLIAKLAELVSKDCGAGCGGSGGAGTTEGEPSDFEDEDEEFPDEFEDREDYENWKCAAANLIIDRVDNDLEYIKDIAATEVSSVILAGALMTPIPLDDIGVLVGVIVTYSVESVIDDMIDDIRDEFALDRSSLVCSLYNALNTTSAVSVMESWSDGALSETAEFFLSFFLSNDSYNILFEKQNELPEEITSCTGCAWDEWAIDLGTLTDGSLDGESEYLGVTTVSYSGSGCTRHEASVTTPDDRDLTLTISTSGIGVPYYCPGWTPPAVAAYHDAVTDAVIYLETGEEFDETTIHVKRDTSLWVRFTNTEELQITVDGVYYG